MKASLLAFGLLLGLSTVAHAADTFPDKPIRFVVPFEGGGPGDIVARRVGDALSKRINQPVVIDIKPGASTIIGSEAVARAAPDGYTIMLVSTTHSVNPSLFKSLPYNPVTDFAPVTLAATSPYVLVINPTVPARTLVELIALARREAGTLNFGSSGTGSAVQLTGELFKAAIGADITHVPYKGSGPALIDLLGGHIQMLFTSTVTAVPYLRDGRLRGMAVTSVRRNAAVPDLPTIAESGYPDFEAASWFGVMAPGKTPAPIVARLQQEITAAVHTPNVVDALSALGAEPGDMTPAAFGTFFQAEMTKWGEVVRRANIKLD